MKKLIIITASIVLLLVAMCLAWRQYDPTVPWYVSEDKMDALLHHASPEARMVEQRMGPFAPQKVSWLVRYHPRYWHRPQLVVSGFPDSSASFLAETPAERFRCYSHYFRARTAAFTIVTTNESPVAKRFALELKGAFPHLPVHEVTSDSRTMEDPTSL